MAQYINSMQRYEITEVEKTMSGTLAIHAEHVSRRLSLIPVMPCEYTGNESYAAFRVIESHIPVSMPFELLGGVKVETDVKFKITKPTSLMSCLYGMEGSIIDRFGGDFQLSNYTVMHNASRGQQRSTPIIYGRNLAGCKQEESLDSVYTGACPYWSDSDGNVVVTLPEKVLHTSSASLYPYERTITLDLSGEFEDQPTEAQLRTAAQSYMDRNFSGVPRILFSIDLTNADPGRAVYDNKFFLGDRVTIIVEQLHLKVAARVVKVKYNVLLERHDELEIGDARETFSDAIAGIARREMNSKR